MATTSLYISNADGYQHFDFWYQTATGANTFKTIPIGQVVKVGDLDPVVFVSATATLMRHMIPAHASKVKPGLSYGTST